MPPEEAVADAPGLGIGPAVPDPDKKAPVQPVIFAPDESSSEPPTTPTETPKAGTADAKPLDWTKVDLRRGKPEDVPAEHRPAFEHLQKQNREMLAENSRRDQDIRQREQQLEDRMRRLEDVERRLSTAPATPATQAEAKGAEKKVSEMLADPELDTDTRSALQLMKHYFTELIEELGVTTRLKRLDEVLPAFEKLTAEQQQANINGLLEQINAAIAEYGDEINEYTTEIREDLGYDLDTPGPRGESRWKQVRKPRINRATGEPHTVKTLYEFHSGKTFMKATSARAEDARIREGAKKKAAPTSDAKTPPDSGKLTEAEGLSQVRELGFGRR